jgi:hypothetical protein
MWFSRVSSDYEPGFRTAAGYCIIAQWSNNKTLPLLKLWLKNRNDIILWRAIK